MARKRGGVERKAFWRKFSAPLPPHLSPFKDFRPYRIPLRRFVGWAKGGGEIFFLIEEERERERERERES